MAGLAPALPAMIYRYSMPLLLMVLALLGCSGEDASSATASPGAAGPAASTTPPAGGPSPTPALLPGATPAATPDPAVDLQWNPAQLPQLPGPEVERPFEAQIPDGKDLWRAYVVEGDGAPVLFYETHRWLQGAPVFNESGGIVLSYQSAVSLPPATPTPFRPPPQATQVMRGFIDMESTGASSRRWEVQLAGTFYGLLSPRGDRIVAASIQGRGPIYDIEPGVEVRRSPAALSPYDWSEKGNRLLLGAEANASTSPPARPIHTWEPGAGMAPRLDTAGPFLPALSPDGQQVAYVDGRELVLAAAAGGNPVRIDLGVALQAQATWNQSGGYVAVNGGAVDVRGARLALPPVEGYPIASAVSPDGRSLVYTTSPYGPDSRCPGSPQKGLANQTVLRSLVGGEDLVLVDCDHGFFANPHWLTGERLLLSGPSCWGCETDAVRFSIADLRTGRIQDLNPAPERGAAFAVSPDGSRLLISGDRLRLYSRDGALLKTIEAPSGFSVLGVAWSPDGSRFAYVVGPPFFTI